MKLIGYTSDSVYEEKNKLYHKYLVSGIARYYSIKIDLSELPFGSTYQGQCMLYKKSLANKFTPSLGRCCYCEVELTEKTKTRDHIIPKHKGGKITKKCCFDCNQEKGGLMPLSYLVFLEDKLISSNKTSKIIIKRKIRNLNRILTSIGFL